MVYKATDYWNSPYIEHHGVKGMKWGVRKAVRQVGRTVRNIGGAIKNTANGIVRVGSAVRRFKNRRAIKSGDANRILKRTKKMSNEELQQAVTRVQLVNGLNNNHGNTYSNSLGSIVSDSLKKKVGQMAADAMQTSIESILVGELPTTGLSRAANVQKQYQLQQISQNKLNAKTNMYKLQNAGLQNDLNVAGMRYKIAENNYNTHKAKRELAKMSKPKNKVSVAAGSVLNRLGNKSVSKIPSSHQSVKIKLYDNSAFTTPVVDIDKATRMPRYSSYTYRHLRHGDISMENLDDYLVHHGVLGMKWGVRKDDLADINVNADDIYRRRESENKAATNDIEDRGYTYVYDPSSTRDDEFYQQFGSQVVDKEFGKEGKIAGYTSAGKAFADHIFDTNDFHEVKYTDTMFKSYQKHAGEKQVMSLLSAPYDPGKSPEENRKNYEDRLTKYGAAVLGSGMGAHRHPWLDEEQKEEGSRDIDTARNDAARRVADILKDEGYIGMRDFKDISGAADINSATILFNNKRKMYDEYYRHDNMSICHESESSIIQ